MLKIPKRRRKVVGEQQFYCKKAQKYNYKNNITQHIGMQGKKSDIAVQQQATNELAKIQQTTIMENNHQAQNMDNCDKGAIKDQGQPLGREHHKQEGAANGDQQNKGKSEGDKDEDKAQQLPKEACENNQSINQTQLPSDNKNNPTNSQTDTKQDQILPKINQNKQQQQPMASQPQIQQQKKVEQKDQSSEPKQKIEKKQSLAIQEEEVKDPEFKSYQKQSKGEIKEERLEEVLETGVPVAEGKDLHHIKISINKAEEHKKQENKEQNQDQLKDALQQIRTAVIPDENNDKQLVEESKNQKSNPKEQEKAKEQQIKQQKPVQPEKPNQKQSPNQESSKQEQKKSQKQKENQNYQQNNKIQVVEEQPKQPEQGQKTYQKQEADSKMQTIKNQSKEQDQPQNQNQNQNENQEANGQVQQKKLQQQGQHSGQQQLGDRKSEQQPGEIDEFLNGDHKIESQAQDNKDKEGIKGGQGQGFRQQKVTIFQQQKSQQAEKDPTIEKASIQSYRNKPTLKPIILTEQNEQLTSITPKQLQSKQIVQFEQYKPIKKQEKKQQKQERKSSVSDREPVQQQKVKFSQKEQKNQEMLENGDVPVESEEEKKQWRKVSAKSKEINGRSEVHREQLPQKYQNVQNQALLKRIQQLQQTVQQLKSHQQQATHDHTAAMQTMQKSDKKKKKQKQQIIHEPSVHGLVAELAKTQTQNTGNLVKKPNLHQKRYKRRKLDLSHLMDKNMSHASNLFNVTIGQIINPNNKHEEEKEILRKEIKQLREKVLMLEEDKRALSTQRPGFDTRRETASTGKKYVCGKLVKISELKASRVEAFQENQSLFNKEDTKLFDKNQTRSQRDSFTEGLHLKNKVSSISATQRQKQQQQKQPQNSLSFRVRRPTAKSTTTPHEESLRQNFQNQQQQMATTLPISSQNVSKLSSKKQHWYEQPFIESIKMPDMPSPPSQFDSQEDLYNLGKLTFLAFGVDVSNAKQMNVKKYKNCVYFNIGQKNNILWYFDGRFYFGDWQVHLTGEGEKSGQGFELVPGKFVYQGMFKQGKRNGIGKIKILGKEKEVIYEGNWVDGNKCGEGKQVDQYGIKYWGEWKDNKRDGFGRLKLEDGDYYQGKFQRGIKTGQGTQYFKNGDKYEGNYLANKFHGKGKYTWKNGSVYEGQFNHGIRSGQGKWKSSESTAQYDSYEGQYQGDKKNGYGKYKWADGSEYEGFFKDDLKEGEGTIRYKNGKVAKLLWRNGQPMKKIFSEQQQKYRETQKSKQKIRKNSKQAHFNKTDSLSSKQFSIARDD